MPTMTVPKITAVSLLPNPVAASSLYTVSATVIIETVEVTLNPLFEFPMNVGSDGTAISELTW